MKILCCCEMGMNRSVHFASLLKNWGNDTIAMGLATTTPETQKMLCDWADLIILTEEMQKVMMLSGYQDKVKVFNVGPDTYHRPMNENLKARVKWFMAQNRSLLKNDKKVDQSASPEAE
jgi:hypothetical protein